MGSGLNARSARTHFDREKDTCGTCRCSVLCRYGIETPWPWRPSRRCWPPAPAQESNVFGCFRKRANIVSNAATYAINPILRGLMPVPIAPAAKGRRGACQCVSLLVTDKHQQEVSRFRTPCTTEARRSAGGSASSSRSRSGSTSSAAAFSSSLSSLRLSYINGKS